MALGRIVLRGIAAVTSMRGLSALSTIAAAALLTRVLPPEQVGGYFIIYALANFLALLSQRGTHVAIVRVIPRLIARDRRADIPHNLRYGLRVIAITLVLTALLLATFAGEALFRALGFQDHTALVLPALAWTVGLAVSTFLAEALRGHRQYLSAGLGSGPIANGLLVLVLVFAYSSGWQISTADVVWYSAGGWLATLLYCLFKTVAVARTHTPGHSGSLSDVNHSNADRTRDTDSDASLGSDHLSQGLGYVFLSSVLSYTLVNVDMWLAGFLVSQSDAGFYGSALRVVMVLTLPLLIINRAISPIIPDLHERKATRDLEETLRISASVAGLPALGFLLVIVFAAEVLLGILFGQAYTEAATVLQILALGKVVNVWSGSCGLLLMMTGHQKFVTVVTCISVTLTVACALALVDTFGAAGIATGSALGIAFHNLCCVVYSARTLDVRTYLTVALTPKRIARWAKRANINR